MRVGKKKGKLWDFATPVQTMNGIARAKSRADAPNRDIFDVMDAAHGTHLTDHHTPSFLKEARRRFLKVTSRSLQYFSPVSLHVKKKPTPL